MGDENLLEYLHFELVNFCVNDKKVRSEGSLAKQALNKVDLIVGPRWTSH